MVAVPLIYGRLGTEDYSDSVASDPRIDELRAKIEAEEECVDRLHACTVPPC